MALPQDPLGDDWLIPPISDEWMNPTEYGAWVPAPPRLPSPRLSIPVPIDATGERGPTRSQSRGPRWRRTSSGLHVPANADFDQPAQRIAEVAAQLPEGAAVTGWASLHLAGARWFEGALADGRLLPVPVAMGPDIHVRPIPGAVLHRTVASEVFRRHGVPCAHVLQAVFDEVRSRPFLGLRIAAIEMACFAELTSLARFGRFVATMRRRKGVGLVREALAHAVEGTESPREVAMRRVWNEAGLPPVLVNRDIYGADGRFLARPDLLAPEFGVVGEYDGAHHLEGGQRRKDLDREGRLRRHGLEYFTIVGGDMTNKALVIRRMHDAVSRARANKVPRRWTLTPPPGAAPRLSLDQRMDRRPEPR